MNSMNCTAAKALFLLFVMCGMIACNNAADTALIESPETDTNKQSEVTFSSDIVPPLDDIDVEMSTHKIDAQKGGTIEIATGTKITIPSNAFIDANGTPINGKVAVNYREFHTVTDVVACGIPMRCSKGEEQGFLKTAGMFELRASADGQPLAIADGKKIEVDMASYKDGSEYDFYYFDEDKQAWQQTGTGTPKPNLAKQQKEKNIDSDLPLQPIPPKKFDENKFVFDLDVDFKQFPELRAFEKVTWQYAGSSAQDDPEQNDWIFEETWEDVKVLPDNMEKGHFAIHFIKGEKVFKTLATPALGGNDYDKAIASYKKLMTDYSQVLGEIADERRRLQQQADFIRSVSITNTGFHNWDYWQNQAERLMITAVFKFDESLNYDVNDIAIFHIFDEESTVLRYPAHKNVPFHFNPKQDNKVVAILPGNKAAVYDEKDFVNLRMQGDTNSELHHEFTLQTLDQPVKSLDELKGVLQGKI